ncbi:Uma2 family endonuclease [Aetokthonos hydrillicola Thurmond2011]|jgi:Uma2 family endonuclease|uniref:Uma2 family endonuclease n=1 Tax=Aetokthonos hydrillicola Thurmond2011 TaxID=2712845 RepID=A0AAP5I915_9CYAN|nr:Uma2 family endonuclease [Aetokthonos hydrillicola]MBO3459502.1 Uma2 family endonuclease [Aetokthonos hydrillicola CCALA 1050]MBW4583865.1 Uma2 family endonuclease [Aetokthonos hydrillicola CCALA 1050]MDR9895438.1 Uma2 family endonuclease [Aetokthonos hydrillicola Thurmond2011]
MSPNTVQNQSLSGADIPDWEPPEPPTDLIFDDGEPLESNRHRIAMNVLIRSLEQAWTDRNDYFAGGNMFIYYSRTQARNRDFKGPDFFVVLNVEDSRSRQGWVVWDEDGRYPDVIVELMSPSTKNVDLREKKNIYERVFRTRDYFVFDPFDPTSLQGWSLDINFHYQPLVANEQGWLWCETLGFWLGTWEGTISRENASWLRFYDREGNLVFLPEEAERQRAEAEHQRAEAQRQRAERLAARLRELGENIDDDES